jgi:membrane-associated phospholipid phosphatase
MYLDKIGSVLWVWSRVALKAHTLPQVLAGAALGAGFAVLFLV